MNWAQRVQPWLGVPLLAVGGWFGLLMLERGVPAQGVAPALIGVGGVMMIAKGSRGSRRLLFLVAALAMAGLFFQLSH
ncbi:MAG: hypothetical protein AAF627_20180 [Myxococcota bacterium]